MNARVIVFPSPPGRRWPARPDEGRGNSERVTLPIRNSQGASANPSTLIRPAATFSPREKDA